MNTKKYNDGIMYIFIGLIFLLITIDLIFPIVMFIMKFVFCGVGGVLIISGIIEIKDSYKKKKDEI